MQTQTAHVCYASFKKKQSFQELKNYKKKVRTQTIHVRFCKFKNLKFKREIKIKSGRTLPIHVHASTFWLLTLSAH